VQLDQRAEGLSVLAAADVGIIRTSHPRFTQNSGRNGEKDRMRNLGPWPKGVSGNPGGRPKTPITEAMQRMLVEPHIAVSTNDLRRLVPFRRRLTDANSAHTANGFMTVGLLTELGGDPMAAYFAMQAGNIRIYEEGPICRILPSFPYSRS